LTERRLVVVALVGSAGVGLVLAVGQVAVVVAEAFGEGGRRSGLETLKGQASTTDLE
jgi:hypothetical protein